MKRIVNAVWKRVQNVLNKIGYQVRVTSDRLFATSKYGIIKGYQHRKEYSYFDDSENTDNWQREVYEKAKEYLEKDGLSKVADFGCGSGYKLIKYFKEYETVGIDVSPTYEYLQETYPDRKWLKVGEFDLNTLSSDIVICSDVIEHVLDPDQLLNDMKAVKDAKYFFISTPDRGILPNAKTYGPPLNPTHIREWEFSELRKYADTHFEVIDHYISNASQHTQLIICKRK